MIHYRKSKSFAYGGQRWGLLGPKSFAGHGSFSAKPGKALSKLG